jgi:hypothetical protein
MEILGIRPLGDSVLYTKKWIVGLFNIRIINFLKIPHFGRGKYVNNCVKQLLTVLQVGFFGWTSRCPSM